jgi:CzcA family heavy metal efflux pump
MMRWIVGSSLKFRFIVIAVAASLIYFGIAKLQKMPVDVFPEFAPPLVEVQTPCLGLSAEEVEELVTIPLEQAFAGVPGLDYLRSKSVAQLSSVKMIFKRGTDLLEARQLVQERMKQVSGIVPTWSSPPVMVPPLSATSRMMKMGITSKKHSLMDLSMITYWTIRQRLMQVPGVANVAIWGERLQMLQVQVDPKRLAEHGITLNEVMDAAADALDVGLLQFSEGHYVGSGGFVDTPNQRLQVRHVLPIIASSDKVSPDQLAEVVIKMKDGQPIRMKDIGDVVIDHQPMIGDGIVNEDVGLMCIVEKFPWGNTLQVTKEVEKAIDAMRPGLPDVEIDTTIFRPATYIETSIDKLTMSLMIGCVLLVIVLFAFLYEWRVALISCIAMPLSLLAAGLVLYYMGATINVMILAGFVIALGDIVDDAIIDIENVVRRLREQQKLGRVKSLKSMARTILEASLEVRGAIVYATLIEVFAILPVFFMQGLSGAFFQPLAMAYALALLVSMIVALTVTPALSLIMLRNAPLQMREPPIVRWLKSIYLKALNPIIRAPRIAYGAVAAIVLAGAVVLLTPPLDRVVEPEKAPKLVAAWWPHLGTELLPSFKERDFLMHWLTDPSCSWPEMNRISIQAGKELLTIPGVRNMGSHIGQALIMDEVVGMYFGENWVSVDPSVDYDETLNKIQETVDGYPGIYRDVQTYLKERIREVLTGSHEAITVRIFGRDLDVLRAKADELKTHLEEVDGLVGLKVAMQQKIPEISVQVNLAAAHQHGIKPGDVRRATSALVNGEEIGDVHIGNRTYDIQVWSTPETRSSLTSIQNLPIDTANGKTVRLADIAEVAIKPTPNVVQHENLMRYIDVGGNVDERDLGSVAADVRAAVKKVDFPLEYNPIVMGEVTERETAAKRVWWMAIVSMIGVFLILHASFKSLRLATLAMVTLPSALVGGILAVYFSDKLISLGSLVGFLTILGIAARNSIMLIDHFQHLERFEGEKFGPDLVIRGAMERLSPIVMTTLTTIVAIIPLVVAGSIPGHEVEHPMAVVILGGMITSTLLNLFVVPSLYLQFGASRTSAIETATGGEPEAAFA